MATKYLTIEVHPIWLPFVFLTTIVSLWVVGYKPSLFFDATLISRARHGRSNAHVKVSTCSSSVAVSAHVPSIVPFLIIDDPDWTVINHAMLQYEREWSITLAGLSRSLEVCLQSENALGLSSNFLSGALRTKISKLTKLHEHNLQILQSLLHEFPVQKMLNEQAFTIDTDHDTTRATVNNQYQDHLCTPMLMHSRDYLHCPPNSSYDSLHQIMAHLVRDWTLEGESGRTSIYDWCRQQIKGKAKSILVPGAGLGRLAWDLSQDGHEVEANESSITMAAVAFHLFQKPERFAIYPFVTDFFWNEVNSMMRFQSIQVIPPGDHSCKRHLSYTIGDFVRLYGSANPRHYDAVVTSFFLDTATNVLEYLAIFSNIIKKGGQWINVGPLQWHGNADLQPAADELKALIPMFGFRIHHWSIDSKPLDYRMEEDPSRFTKYEGYLPIRLVATKVSHRKKKFPIDTLSPTSRYATPATSVAPAVQQPPLPLSTVTIEEFY